MYFQIQFTILALVLVSAVKAFVEAESTGFRCKNHKGQSVDWFIALKFPRFYNEGLQYYYIDSRSENPKIYDDINGSDSPIFQTLGQAKYITSDQHGAVFWNDEPFNDESSTYGFAHSKGSIAFKNEEGFILNHSAPKFPQFSDDVMMMEINSSQLYYGQHFFCISTDVATINEYAKYLQIDRVFPMRESQIPSSYKNTASNLISLLDKKQSETQQGSFSFKSLAGNEYTLFAKSGLYQVDFYQQIVAKHYNLPFSFETWGRGLEDPTCSVPQVVANLNMYFNDEIKYSYSNDHSKFGMSMKGNIVCFGDINRMVSQNKRGGGTTCFENEKIHSYIKAIFETQQLCEESDKSNFFVKFMKSILLY